MWETVSRGVDLQNVLRRVKEGRGQGQGAEYRPYIQAKDIPSQGLTTRGTGWKTGRVHHFLSRLELNYFYTLEWSSVVLDIREQFPLLEGTEITTLSVAESLGIPHPSQYNKRQRQQMPMVMTTDLVVTAKLENRVDDFPRSVKYGKDLADERTVEKLELERQMWASWGKELKLVTEQEINKTLAANVRQIHQSRDAPTFGNLSQETLFVISELLTSKVQQPHTSLARAALAVDENLGVEVGQSLAIAKYLIASRQWQINMMQPFEPTRPIELIGVELRGALYEAANQPAR